MAYTPFSLGMNNMSSSTSLPKRKEILLGNRCQCVERGCFCSFIRHLTHSSHLQDNEFLAMTHSCQLFVSVQAVKRDLLVF